MPARSLPARALAGAAAALAAAACVAGCGGSGAPPARPVADLPPGGLAPRTAWYVRRTYAEPLDGEAPATGGRWHAALPVRAETWTSRAAGSVGFRVTARVVVAGPARFASEDDRLAYLASGSDDADIRPGTVLQDGLTSGASGALSRLGLAADVGTFPPTPTPAAVRELERFSAEQQTIRPSTADRLEGLGDVLAVAPVPRAYRLELFRYASTLPGVRAWRDGDGLVLRARNLRLVVDARTGALRDAGDLALAPGRVEVQSVVGAAYDRPATTASAG